MASPFWYPGILISLKAIVVIVGAYILKERRDNNDRYASDLRARYASPDWHLACVRESSVYVEIDARGSLSRNLISPFNGLEGWASDLIASQDPGTGVADARCRSTKVAHQKRCNCALPEYLAFGSWLRPPLSCILWSLLRGVRRV